MATRRARAVKTAQKPQAQAIQEPGLHEEVMGELEHGGKSAAQLASALEETLTAILDALAELRDEGSVNVDIPPLVYRIAKGGAQ